MKKTALIDLPNLSATERFGDTLGKMAQGGEVITLAGDLGAGKTTLTQSIGRGLKIPGETHITSPTFSLLHEYEGKLFLYHMDLYRLAGPDEIEVLGFEEYIYGNGLTVIEWPDRLGEMLPENRLDINLSLKSGSARSAAITPHGRHWSEKLPLILTQINWNF